MAVALAPDQAIFDNISLVRIGACFMNDRQECIRWCRQYGLLGYADGLPNLPLPLQRASFGSCS